MSKPTRYVNKSVPFIPPFLNPYSLWNAAFVGVSSPEYSSYLTPYVNVILSEIVYSSIKYIDESSYSKIAAASLTSPVFEPDAEYEPI